MNNYIATVVGPEDLDHRLVCTGNNLVIPAPLETVSAIVNELSSDFIDSKYYIWKLVKVANVPQYSIAWRASVSTMELIYEDGNIFVGSKEEAEEKRKELQEKLKTKLFLIEAQYHGN